MSDHYCEYVDPDEPIQGPPPRPVDGYAVEARDTWLDKLTRWLFPRTYLDPPPEAPGFMPGYLSVHTFISLDWKDRLRILCSGKAELRAQTQTDVVVNHAKTISAINVLPPWHRPVTPTPGHADE